MAIYINGPYINLVSPQREDLSYRCWLWNDRITSDHDQLRGPVLQNGNGHAEQPKHSCTAMRVAANVSVDAIIIVSLGVDAGSGLLVQCSAFHI